MAKKKESYLMRPCCGSCRHWERLDDDAQMPAEDVLGVCLRYPPTVTGRDDADQTLQDLPIVEAQHRCGEFGGVLN